MRLVSDPWRRPPLARPPCFEVADGAEIVLGDTMGPANARSCGLRHLRFQRDGLAVDHEVPIPVMVDGLWLLLLGIRPGLYHFEDKEVVLIHQARVHNPALEVSEAFGDEGRCHGLGWPWRESELLELVNRAARRIPLTTTGANSTAGIAMTHSCSATNAAKL